jgi:microcystin-dependent protein
MGLMPSIGNWSESQLWAWVQQQVGLQGNLRNSVEIAVVGRVVLPGSGLLWYSETPPEGYLLCDGTSHLRADYPDLFDVIGTTFGAADGTHFNVPDLRQRFPLGKAASGTGAALGATGGAIDHTHSFSATSGSNSGTAAFADSAIGTHDRSVAISPHTHSVSGTADTQNPPFQVVHYLIKT